MNSAPERLAHEATLLQHCPNILDSDYNYASKHSHPSRLVAILSISITRGTLLAASDKCIRSTCLTASKAKPLPKVRGRNTPSGLKNARHRAARNLKEAQRNKLTQLSVQMRRYGFGTGLRMPRTVANRFLPALCPFSADLQHGIPAKQTGVTRKSLPEPAERRPTVAAQTTPC